MHHEWKTNSYLTHKNQPVGASKMLTLVALINLCSSKINVLKYNLLGSWIMYIRMKRPCLKAGITCLPRASLTVTWTCASDNTGTHRCVKHCARRTMKSGDSRIITRRRVLYEWVTVICTNWSVVISTCCAFTGIYKDINRKLYEWCAIWACKQLINCVSRQTLEQKMSPT